MGFTAGKADGGEQQDYLRELARKVVSEISELDQSQSKELLGVFVSEMFLYVAEQERREVRRQRQAEGIAAAKARGVRFGPERLTLPPGFEATVRLWSEGAISANSAAKELGMSRDRFLRRAREYCTDHSCVS